MAELPLTVQLVSVAVPTKLYRPPPSAAELPLMVQLADQRQIVAAAVVDSLPRRRRCRWRSCR